ADHTRVACTRAACTRSLATTADAVAKTPNAVAIAAATARWPAARSGSERTGRKGGLRPNPECTATAIRWCTQVTIGKEFHNRQWVRCRCPAHAVAAAVARQT